MDFCRAFVASAFVGIISLLPCAFAEDTPASETLLDLIQKKHDFKAAWGGMFKGEYSPPYWMCNLDATSKPTTDITIDGKNYIFGSICKANDCDNDHFIALFNDTHHKCWGLQVTVPSGIGADGAAHPKKYAALRYFGEPDQAMRKNLMAQLEKEPNWK